MDVITMYNEYFEIFGIEKYIMQLSTHDKAGLGGKFVDNEALWLKTEAMVRRAMDNGGIPYIEEPGEAAFYGPKVDVQVWSAIGREFTLATNQVDFAQPARFGLSFVNREGEDETPLCIHRAPLSTHERMIGFLIEHFAGKFPVWLAPEQVRVIPITDDQGEYARSLVAGLKALGVRAAADLGSDRMNAKIRAAQLMQVPYMLVVGDREVNAGTVSLRTREGERLNGLPTAEFQTRVLDRIKRRALAL
jgi:threonyl-tRNA synthetase